MSILCYFSPFADEIVDLVCEEQVPVVTTGAGNPAKYMARFKEHNIKVIPVVPSVALAKRMEKLVPMLSFLKEWKLVDILAS